MLVILLLVVALVLFVLAGFAWPPVGRFSLIGFGLAFATLAALVERGVL